MEENYTQKITLAEVAEKTYVSQWHLSKLLNGHTGKSFSELLNHIRIEEAKKLLKDPSLRIGDISEEVGFMDVALFQGFQEAGRDIGERVSEQQDLSRRI